MYLYCNHCDIKEKNKIKKSFCLCSSLKWTYKETKIHLDFSSKNKADWIKVFNDLIDRGLKRLMLIVSDDFPGIIKAIETLFPSRKKFLSWFMTSSKTDSKSFLIPIFSWVVISFGKNSFTNSSVDLFNTFSKYSFLSVIIPRVTN